MLLKISVWYECARSMNQSCYVRFEVFTAVFLRSVRRLLVTASVVHSSPILVTLMKEALSSSETTVITTTTRRKIQEDAILLSHVIFYVEIRRERDRRNVSTEEHSQHLL
jgi:hypothetical protein